MKSFNGFILPFLATCSLFMCTEALAPVSAFAYPVFGTKRYGRSSIPVHRAAAAPSWAISAIPAYAMPATYRAQPPAGRIHGQISHYPTAAYYDAPYPYTQDFADDYYYYPQGAYGSYPIYYAAPARPSDKYDAYDTALPYYYAERHAQRQHQPRYGYYGGYGAYEEPSDPVDDLQEEILQEEEREEREDSLPIGQETWYEGEVPSQHEEDDGDRRSIDAVNAAFLQNLIVSQMYNDAMNKAKNVNNRNDIPISSRKNMEGYISGDDRDYIDDVTPISSSGVWYPELKNEDNDFYHRDDYYNDDDMDNGEDEDVRELKSLQKVPGRTNYVSRDDDEKRRQWSQNYKMREMNNKRMSLPQVTMKRVSNIAFKKQEHSEHGPWGPSHSTLTFTDRKTQTLAPRKETGNAETKLSSSTMSVPSSTTTQAPNENKQPTGARDARGGQKEVVLLRPATPVRHPFAEPVIEMLSQQQREEPERKRAPSVYDTIKQLLDMEEQLDDKMDDDVEDSILRNRPKLHKRFVSNEGSLVDELSQLKKSA